MSQNEKLRHHDLLRLMRNADASDVAQAFLDWLQEMRDLQEKSWQIVINEDDRIQDFLHEIEFEPNSKKRAVIATKLHESRCKRRTAKDISKKLKPLTDFVKEATNRSMIKLLKKMQADLKAQEDFVNGDRVYKPKGKDGDI